MTPSSDESATIGPSAVPLLPVQSSESYIDAALEAAHGRKSQAAKMLDVNRRTLYRREERMGEASPRGEEG